MSDLLASMTEGELRRHGARLRALALRLVADEATADDLAQEAWLELARRSEGGVRDLPAFLTGVIRKLSMRRSRGEARRSLRERAAARDEALPDTVDLNATLEAQRQLIEELQALPESLRVPLLLRFYEDCSAAEIARRCGLPATTVRSRITRGLEQLRAGLDRRHGGRQAWAIALVHFPGKSTAAAGVMAYLAGATTMQLTFKLSAALAILAVAGTLIWYRGTNVTPPHRPVTSIVNEQAALAGVQPSRFEPSAKWVKPEARENIAATGPPVLHAPMTLDVVDRESQRPAPYYAVRLQAEGREPLLIETDEDGQARIPGAWLDGTFELMAVDHPDYGLENPSSQEVTPRQASADEPLVFEVELGPSYALILPRPAPTTPVTALLDFVGFQAVTSDGVPDGVPLRGGAHPWVRFPPQAADPVRLGHGPWFVCLRDRLGHWQAWAEVRTIKGPHPGPVQLEGGSFGGVELYVTVDGETHHGIIDFTLQSTGQSPLLGTGQSPLLGTGQNTGQVDDWRARLRVGMISGEGGWRAGRFSLAYLPAGDYRFDFTARGVESRSVDLHVEAGTTEALPIELKALGRERTLSIRVLSESGTLSFPYIGVRATELGSGDAKVLRASNVLGDKGPGALFRLDDLAQGSWKVELERVHHLPAFDHDEGITVDAGTGEVVFTCLDANDPLLEGQVVLVRDEQSGQLLDGALTVWAGGEPFLTVGFFQGRIEFPPIRSGASIDWLVLAAGHRPFYARGDVFPPRQASSQAEQEGDPAALQLERGWGAMVVTRSLDITPGGDTHLELLPGVALQVDGVDQGRTDNHGRLLLSAEEVPESVRLTHPTREHYTGSIDLQSGRLNTPSSVHPLYEFLRLRPAESER